MKNPQLPLLTTIIRVLKQAHSEGHTLVTWPDSPSVEFISDIVTMKTDTDLLGYVTRDPEILGQYGHKHTVVHTLRADIYCSLVTEIEQTLGDAELATSVVDSLLGDDTLTRHAAGIEMHLSEGDIDACVYLWRESQDIGAVLTYLEMLVPWLTVQVQVA